MILYKKLESLTEKTVWGTSDIYQNRAFYEGSVLHPYLDNFMISEGLFKKPEWRDENNQTKDFCVVLSHDVDSVRYYDWRDIQRRRASKRGYSVSSQYQMAKNIYHNAFKASKEDPFNNFDKWMDLESKLDVKSTYFFFPSQVSDRHADWDCSYFLSDEIMHYKEKIPLFEIMQRLEKEGHEIGLHGSFYSKESLEMLQKQKDEISHYLIDDIKSIRQHYLSFDMLTTPKLQETAGFLYESTYGFNNATGFRAGTSFPFLFDESNLLEIPLIVQDGALHRDPNGYGMTQKSVLNHLIMMMQRIQKVGGVMTLLWHPHTWLPKTEWMIDVYEEFIHILKSEGACFKTTQEVGHYWRENYLHQSEQAFKELEEIPIKTLFKALS